MELYHYYPELELNTPRYSLGDFPTPVQKLERLNSLLGLESLYIKRDDQSAPFYGGNKIRKLEFLFADAKIAKADEVLTFGFAGSNHAAATAIHAHRLGMRSISVLAPQPVSDIVRKNLLLSHVAGAELHLHPIETLTEVAKTIIAEHKQKTGKEPYLIPAGGSSSLGTLGFVNAALELAAQIKAGELPEPDYIYATLGTSGTVVGLMVGLKLANLKTKIIPVSVVDGSFMNENTVASHYNKTVAFLKQNAPSFPDYSIRPEDIEIEKDFYGNGYGLFTNEGTEACKLIKNHEGITLEGTYTGKTLAALIADARKGKLKNKKVLFWNTFNSVDFNMVIDGVDFRDLPEAFHPFF